VGNLHASLQEIDLIQVFRPFGRIVECCKKWLHFGFVKFTTEEEACHAYVTLNGFRLKGRPMRLEFQNRSKKARIKAILAQAALQATSVNMLAGGAASLSAQDQLLSMGNYGNY
jgi:RNA recognition motif-containing protein